MVLALTNDWRNAVQKSDAELRFKVKIDCGGGNTYTCFDGLTRGARPATADVGVAQISPIVAEIDPLTRRMQNSAVFVTFYDKWLRDKVVGQRLKGKEITITIGERDLDEGEYAAYFEGIIDRVVPEVGGSLVTLECVDWIQAMRTRKVVGYWNQLHPLQAIVDIMAKAGIPNSRIDLTSFDPDTAANAPIGHFVVGRSSITGFVGDDCTVREPTEPYQLINQLVLMTNGSIIVNEAGQLQFVLFDPTTPTVADWDDQQIGRFEQLVLDENIVNRVSVGFLGFPREYNETLVIETPKATNPAQTQARTEVVTKVAQMFQLDETVSQAEFEHPDSSDGGVYEAAISMPWANGLVYWVQEYLDTDGTIQMPLFGQSICGFRGILPGPQSSQAALSTSKRLWLYMQGEVFSVTAIALSAGTTVWNLDGSYEQRDPNSEFGSQYVQTSVIQGLFDLTATRGELGTTAVGSNLEEFLMDTNAVDITIPKFVAEKTLERFAFGAFVVEVETSFLEYDKQLLDQVTLDNRNFVGKGFDGITAGSGDWEIISKEPDYYANPPRIKWQLMFIPPDGTTVVARNWLAAHRNSAETDQIAESGGAYTGQGYIQSGLVLSAGTGLVAGLSSGNIANGTVVRNQATELNIALEASSDNYIFKDLRSGMVVAVAVTIDDPPPTRPRDSVFMGKVVTGVSSVASVVQNKTPGENDVPIAPINGNRVQENTLGPRSLDTKTRVFGGRGLQPNSDFGSFRQEPDDYKA